MTQQHELAKMIANRRDVGVAYLLAIAAGILGAHRFYLGRKGSAFAMLLLSISMIGLPIAVIWFIVDLFLISDMTRDYNQALMNGEKHGI